MSKQDYFKTAIDWMRRRGFSNIKANYGDFDTPMSFSKKDGDRTIVPDLSGLKTGRKNFAEIVTKSDQKRQMVTKWKLLSTIARMRGGKLFLLAPRGYKSFAKRLVDRHNLAAEVVYLK